MKADDVQISLDCVVAGTRPVSWGGPVRAELRTHGSALVGLEQVIHLMCQRAADAGCNWLLGIDLQIDMWPTDGNGTRVEGVATGAILERSFGGPNVP